ncbi:glycosyltransferase family 2 protein [Irregularibacter muris]|uniref:Glycosyltransferase family 2 protein n=1 Tax=Irregularibacter muris TaxID=1796619 RepID=A0AAE3HJW3_9FIRM|nr:glycosyltransferase family 2 protein [Irregularibacter muris]MCR1900083.1 glycosyltransferase family 2 protein [Irregularibacter muris]
MDKKVSIIIPIYKVEKYLRKCLDSILAQTNKEFIVYLVNDGSPDKCDEIINEYKLKYPELFIVLNKENGGLSSARNLALQEVNTKYVMFIDSDDYVHKQYVEVLLKNAEKYDADIVECGHKIVYIDNDWKKDIKPKLSGVYSVQNDPDVICDMLVEACGKIYKSELFLKHNIFYPIGLIYEDTATTPRLIARSKIIVSIQDCLYYYLQRQGSIMSEMDHRIYQLYNISDLLGEDRHADIFPKQFELCRINRILILIQKIIMSNGSKKEVCRAYDYLDSKIPNWKNNEIFIKNTKNSPLPTKLYRFLVINRYLSLMKIAIKMKYKLKLRY